MASALEPPYDQGPLKDMVKIVGLTAMVKNPEYEALANERADFLSARHKEESARTHYRRLLTIGERVTGQVPKDVIDHIRSDVTAMFLVNDDDEWPDALLIDTADMTVGTDEMPDHIREERSKNMQEKINNAHDSAIDMYIISTSFVMLDPIGKEMQKLTGERQAQKVTEMNELRTRITERLTKEGQRFKEIVFETGFTDYFPLTVEELRRYFLRALTLSAKLVDDNDQSVEQDAMFYTAVVNANPVPVMVTRWFDVWVKRNPSIKLNTVDRLRDYVRRLVYKDNRLDGEPSRASIQRSISLARENQITDAYVNALNMYLDSVVLDAGYQFPSNRAVVTDAVKLRKRAVAAVNGNTLRLYANSLRTMFLARSSLARVDFRLARIDEQLSKTDEYIERPIEIERSGVDTRPIELMAYVTSSDQVDLSKLKITFEWFMLEGGSSKRQPHRLRSTDAGVTSKMRFDAPSFDDPLYYNNGDVGAPAQTLAGSYVLQVKLVDDASSTTTTVLVAKPVRVRVFADCVRCANKRFEVGYEAPRHFGECRWREVPVDHARKEFMNSREFTPLRNRLSIAHDGGYGETFVPRFDDHLIVRFENDAPILADNDEDVLRLANEKTTFRRYFTFDGLVERLDDRYEREHGITVTQLINDIFNNTLNKKYENLFVYENDLSKEIGEYRTIDALNKVIQGRIELRSFVFIIALLLSLEKMTTSERRFVEEMRMRMFAFEHACRHVMANANSVTERYSQAAILASSLNLNALLIDSIERLSEMRMPLTMLCSVHMTREEIVLAADAWKTSYLHRWTPVSFFVDDAAWSRFERRVRAAEARSMSTYRRQLEGDERPPVTFVVTSDAQLFDWADYHSASTAQPTPYSIERNIIQRGSERLRVPIDFGALHRQIEQLFNELGDEDDEKKEKNLRDLINMYNAIAQFFPRIGVNNGDYSLAKLEQILFNKNELFNDNKRRRIA